MPETWLLVLARDPAGAKTRLAAVLDPPARAALAVAMLGDVLAASRDAPFARRIVVTESDAMRDVAKTAEIETLHVPLSTTNEAAAAALLAASAGGAARALVLAADLPLLQPSDLEALLDADAAIAIAPDRHARGTNALLLAPPLAMEPAFGAGSFAAHQERARSAGLRASVVLTSGLATDVDDADDLRLVVRDPSLGPRTAAALAPFARDLATEPA